MNPTLLRPENSAGKKNSFKILPYKYTFVSKYKKYLVQFNEAYRMQRAAVCTLDALLDLPSPAVQYIHITVFPHACYVALHCVQRSARTFLSSEMYNRNKID